MAHTAEYSVAELPFEPQRTALMFRYTPDWMYDSSYLGKALYLYSITSHKHEHGIHDPTSQTNQ